MSQFERAVLQELHVDASSLLADRTNWKLYRNSHSLWTFSFSSTQSIKINISLNSEGVLLGEWRDSFRAPRQKFWLGNLGYSEVFASASARLIEQIGQHALPFLDSSLDNFELARMLLFKSMVLAGQWRRLHNDEVAWIFSVVQCAREQLNTSEGLRADRWRLLLATAANLYHGHSVSRWSTEDGDCLRRTVYQKNYQTWFKNRFEELVVGDCREAKNKWEPAIELLHIDWFITQADIQTLLLVDHLL